MSDIILPENFELKTEYVWLTEWLKEDLQKIALERIERLQVSYLKKYVDTTAKVSFHLRVEKNKAEKFICSFNVIVDWERYHRDNDNIPFKEPYDIVSHAFKHFKEYLANK